MNIGDDGGKNPHACVGGRWDERVLAGGRRQAVDRSSQTTDAAREVFAYGSGSGYVGYGEVVAAAVPENVFIPAVQSKRVHDLSMQSAIDQRE